VKGNAVSVNAGWTELNLSASSEAVEALDSFKSSAQSVISVVENIVAFAKTVADFVLSVYVDLSDLEAEAIRAAIQALREILADLTESTGAYFLFVPMRMVDPLSVTGEPALYYLGNSDTRGIPVLETVPGPEYINVPSSGSAGNYGFYTQVAESMQDELDPMKPEFGPDAYVASFVFLFGTDTLAELIILAQKLMRLFELPATSNLIPSELDVVPKNLRLRLIPVPMTGDALLEDYVAGDGDFSSQPYAVRVEWSKAEKNVFLAAFGNIGYEIKKVKVWRWEESESSQEKIEAGYGPDPIWEGDYNPLVNFMIDQEVETDKVYWYGVGFTVDYLDPSGNLIRTLDLPHIAISTGRLHIPRDPRIQPGGGVPPDWMAAPILSMIPGLQELVFKFNTWLDTVEAGIRTGKDDLEEFIETLQAEIDRYSSWILDITSAVGALVDALSWPEVYAGIWAMPPGKGGNQYFLSQLGKAMFNQSDPSRPPFDTGTEAVTGLVVYTGSETAGIIEKFVQTIELLFGNFMSGQENKLATAIDTMTDLESELSRQICLTQALIRKECDEAEIAPATVGSDLQASNESTSCEEAGLKSVTNVKFVNSTDALTSDK
jgi:hypothetical protein